MKKATSSNRSKIIGYYNTFESKFGYPLILKGIRHFGYYPKGRENISMFEAQKNMEDILGKKLSLPPNSLVLDAGCGEGNVAIHLAKQFNLNIHGIDLLDISIKRARKKVRKSELENDVKFTVGDYTEVDLPKNSFDGIYTMETLVHIATYPKALSKFRELLKPHGKLVLFEYTLNPDKTIKAKENLWRDIIEGTGMFGLPFFHHGKFANILKKAGFKNIEVIEITENIRPMLKKFYNIGFIPYKFIKLFGLEKKFVNAMAGVEAYEDILKNDSWRYIIATAEKS